MFSSYNLSFLQCAICLFGSRNLFEHPTVALSFLTYEQPFLPFDGNNDGITDYVGSAAKTYVYRNLFYY